MCSSLCCSTIPHRPTLTLVKDLSVDSNLIGSITMSEQVVSSDISLCEDANKLRASTWSVSLRNGTNIAATSFADLEGLVLISNASQAISYARLATSTSGRRFGFEQTGWEVQDDGTLFSFGSTVVATPPKTLFARSVVAETDGSWKIDRVVAVANRGIGGGKIFRVEERVNSSGKYTLLSKVPIGELASSVNIEFISL